MTFEFVQATESDRDYLLELRKQTMTKYLEMAGQVLSDQEHVDRLNHKYECSNLVFLKSVRIGFVKYLATEKELKLIQIQLEPKYQGKGYGTDIIRKVMSLGKDRTIKLSVLKGNPAVELYKRLGFQTISEDKYEYHMQNEH